MAFNRKASLKAGDLNQALLISDLHFKFEVNRDRQFKANNATIRVYNPSQSTINNVLQKGKSIVIEAGYEDEGTGVIYIGQITTSTPGREGPDTVLDIVSNSLQGTSEDLASTIISLSYKKETEVISVLKNLATIMNLAPYGLEHASGVALKNGYVFTGAPKSALDYCADIIKKEGLIIFIDNESLIVSPEVDPPEVGVTDLRVETGLLQAKKLNSTKDKGKAEENKLANKITFVSILNQQIGPNRHIQVDNGRDINGLYVVDKCTFTGANFGASQFTVKGEAIGAL